MPTHGKLARWVRPIYRGLHDLIFKNLLVYPFFPQRHNGRDVLRRHVSGEHLEDPSLDDALFHTLRKAGIKVEEYFIDGAGFAGYLSQTDYPAAYYGGGLDPRLNFVEKALEHYVSLDFLGLRPGDTFIDVAASNSPFHQIIKDRFPGIRAYQQDLIFPPGVHAHRIGGPAGEIPLSPASVRAVTLHCALEHFEGEDDMAFFRRMEKILVPGGRVVVLPFYLAREYTIHVDPAFNLLRGHRVRFDRSDRYRLRYADWYQHFSRHYDVDALLRRIVRKAPGLEPRIYRVRNFRQVHPGSYLRWIGVFEKRSGSG